MEDPTAFPKPAFGDTTAPKFVAACSNDRRYLELFKWSVAGHAEGLPPDSVEKLDLIMRRAYPKIFRERRGNKAPSRLKLVDWRIVESARKRKRICYRTQQRMWKTDRRPLVKVILDDILVNPRPPAIGKV